MDNNLLKIHNPRLFYDGVCREKIPYSLFAELETGSAVTSPFIEGFFGYPQAPGDASFNPDFGAIPIGPGSGYPRPWRSLSQGTQNSSYGSLIGPYARIVRLPDNDPLLPNTCRDTDEDGIGNIPSNCGGSGGLGVFGRIGIGDGQYYGFRSQNWYLQSEGTYNTAYFNTEFGVDWPTWKAWWNGASKKTITVKWMDLTSKPLVDVEIAHATPDVGDADYYPGFNLSAFSDSSLTLLSSMVAIAAVARWL